MVPFDELTMVRVVRHDCGDLDRQLADPGAEEQVVEAVLELRDHDEHPPLLPLRPQLPSRSELLADRFEVGPQSLDTIAGLVGDAEVDAQEQLQGRLVVELFEFLDVSAVCEQGTGHGMRDSGALGAFEGEDVVLHVRIFLSVGRSPGVPVCRIMAIGIGTVDRS